MTARRVVTAPVTTVWTSPDAPRAVDAPATADVPDVARWASSMSLDVRLGLHGRTLTQALAGEPVELVTEDGEWSQVLLPWQPAAEPGGYPGWVRTAHLGPVGPEVGETVVVTATPTTMATTPGGAVELSYATVLRRLTDVEVPAGRSALRLADGRVGHVADHAVQPWPRPLDAAALLASVRRHVGLPYLWGGTSGHGMDCSGLVHLTLRTYGVTVPRDASDQYDALQPVEVGDVRAGDVYFFAPPDTPPTHVGWVSRPGRLLHASEGRDVEDVPMTPERTKTLLAAARPVG